MIITKDQRPRTACEFSAAQIVAAHVDEGRVIDSVSVRSLPPGAVVPTLAGTNIAARIAVRTAVQEAVTELGEGRHLTVILPDACCRVLLINLDVVPGRPEEADAFVRLRLRRSLPFDIEKACVSWQVQNVNGKASVLAGVVLKTVLEEYESVVREAGCSPGLVFPSILAALGQVDGRVPTLLIKVDATTMSLAVVDSLAVVLVRILDRAPGELAECAQLAALVHHSLAFCQDVHGSKVQRILVSAVTPAKEVSAFLEESTGIPAQGLVRTKQLHPRFESQHAALGGVVGALVLV